MISKVREWFASSLSWRVCLLTLACAALCLAHGFSSEPRLYPVDYGQYEPVLRQCSLTWTEEDLALGELQYGRPVTAFRYTRFAWSSLLTPQAGGGLVYLTALCRVLTQPFGLNFSTDLLAFLEALLLTAAAVLLMLSLRRLFPRVWFCPLILLCGMFADGNFCAMLRGLYPEGAAVTLSLLLTALTLYAFSLPGERRAAFLPPVIVLSFITVKSLIPLIVFLPLIIAAIAALFITAQVIRRKKYALAVACALLLIAGCTSTLSQDSADADYFSDASVYESVFNTMLPAADEPEKLLAQFGLSADYAEDIGKSYYEEAEQYAHNPRNAAEAEALFSHLTVNSVFGVYLRNPGVLYRVLENAQSRIRDGFENTRNLTLTPNASGYSATRAAQSLLFVLWRMLPHTEWMFLAAQALLLVGGVALAAVRRQARPLWFSLTALCASLFLPFCVILDGYGQAQEYLLFQLFLTLLLWAEGLSLAAAVLPKVTQWLTRYADEPYQMEDVAGLPAAENGAGQMAGRKLWKGVIAFADNPKRVVCLTAVIAIAVLCLAFLPADHPAGVNNGDYGRMMEQLDLTWSSVYYFDNESQVQREAIEEYAYAAPFQPLKLTPLKSTYSLYWFASVVRLMTEPFGRMFSTLLLAWVMGITGALCVVSIVRDLHPLLKKWTLAAALLLCAMLFSETYLTWYDSLYGEGCILIGLLMTLACAVHLLLMPREKNWRRVLWLAALALSLNILVTAKAQMLMAAPGAVALFALISFYQRPYRYDLQALQGLISLAVCAVLLFSSVSVYQTDRTEDSVSQKHTMWQAYFYGIFMISDDPLADMEALGVDTAMAADIGKHVDFSEDAEYVYAPLSEEAERAFYSHVSIGTILSWYLTHPDKLWYMLDHAAQESQSLYSSFRVYSGQNYSAAHDTVSGFNLWPGWRAYLTPGSFLGYVLLYGALLILCLRQTLKRGAPAQQRVLCALPLFLMVTGVLQFPLSVLGNGFADNQKQLFCFSLCHDLLLGGSLLLAFRWLWNRGRPKPAV